MAKYSFLGRKEEDTLLQDILRYASMPNLISFAGAVPDPAVLQISNSMGVSTEGCPEDRK